MVTMIQDISGKEYEIETLLLRVENAVKNPDAVLKKQYENFRSKYWRWRAKQIDKAEL